MQIGKSHSQAEWFQISERLEGLLFDPFPPLLRDREEDSYKLRVELLTLLLLYLIKSLGKASATAVNPVRDDGVQCICQRKDPRG